MKIKKVYLPASKLPKLPHFNDTPYTIDAFLFRFETHAKSMNWEESNWVTYLAPFLTGNALELYYSLSSFAPISYTDLKKSLLKFYDFTVDGFNKRFRSIKPEPNASLEAFAEKLRASYRRWIEAADVDNFQKLSDLILREQFLLSVSNELAAHIKERNLTDFTDAVKTVEAYRSAHPGENLSSRDANISWNLSGSTIQLDRSRPRARQRATFTSGSRIRSNSRPPNFRNADTKLG